MVITKDNEKEVSKSEKYSGKVYLKLKENYYLKATAWYLSAITLMFDRGEVDSCKVHFKFETSLRTRIFSSGMDCNQKEILGREIFYLELGHQLFEYKQAQL